MEVVEKERLAALRRCEILDTPPDGSFDRVTRLAAEMFEVPISIISLVDEDRIWFKSRHGVEACEVPRSLGLCASAILRDVPLVLSDATRDLHAMTNPLVAGEMGFRFYAGVPLRTHDGHRLGTICVIDRVPRDVTSKEVNLLASLAGVVMDEIELRLASRRAAHVKETMLREVHHRVKNNLQTIASLVALKSRTVPAVLRAHFAEILSRIEALGALHQRFYHSADVGHIDLLPFLSDLASGIVQSHGVDKVTVRSSGVSQPIGLDRATPLALISAEIVSNACKHAFEGAGEKLITIVVETGNGETVVTIEDSGRGLPAGGVEDGMGLRLARLMAVQMEGRTCLERSAGGGTRFELRFPNRDQAITPAAFAVYVPPRHKQASRDDTGPTFHVPEAGM